MFIAMNRFKVKAGSEKDFEDVWLNREVKLAKEKGFVSFRLLQGPKFDEGTLYASHTVWQSEDDFVAWTKGEAFREAHRGAESRAPLYLGGPHFEGFRVLQTVEAAA